jgi:3-methyladenine DNA glycosylase AlkD
MKIKDLPKADKSINTQHILKKLKLLSNPKNTEGMARFGINTENALGVSIPFLRGLAKKIGKNHKLAQDLWNSGVHEARILASIIDDFKLVTEKQMEKWVKEFNSWDVCDQVCMNLFDKTPFAVKKVKIWTKSSQEFVKRAGFALMASLAIHDKKMKDRQFVEFFALIEKESKDERNFVKKAVNWALRQIGKRNKKLNKEAVRVAKKIQKMNSGSAKWIANNALRELQSDAVRKKWRKQKT